MIEQTRSLIKEYFVSNHWSCEEDSSSREARFYKKRRPSQEGYSFFSFSKRKRPILIKDAIQNIRDHFKLEGLERENTGTVLGTYKQDPLFISAAIQYFSGYFHNRNDLPRGTHYLEQPSIRTNANSMIGPGKTSSFVNLATANCDSNPEEHIKLIDSWLNLISKMGLFVSDFDFLLRPKRKANGFWSSVSGDVLKFNYGGLEVGTAGSLAMEGTGDRMITDIGFGLERLIWAMNKEPYFFDMLGPKPLSFEMTPEVIDSLRTATLMGLSGLSLNDSDRYRHFKLYLQRVPPADFRASEVIEHYFNYWTNFIGAKRSLGETRDLVRSELNKQRNSEILSRLGFEPHKDSADGFIERGTDEFLNYLLSTGKANLEQIRGVLK